MYVLEIQKSRSKNFPKVLAYGLSIKGVFESDKLSISFENEFFAYDKLLPIFRLNVLKWKGTKAFFNGVEVEPYRFVFNKPRIENTKTNRIPRS